MTTLLLLGVVGALAQLTAGSLGMGYGVVTTSALLAVGMTPALASASVHLAEIGTSASLGLSHWRLGNVDRGLVLRLGGPGAVGAFVGALGLTSLSPHLAKTAMASVLVPLGVFIVVRFALRPPTSPPGRSARLRTRFLVPVGLVGGFVDAVGGGGWGPVSTTTLLASGRTAPRTVVGSVDAAKLLVTVSASLGFVVALGLHEVPVDVVLVLLLSGVVVAPFAAWLVSRLPHSVLGTAAGGIVVLVNLSPLLDVVGVPADLARWTVAGLGLVWALAVTRSALRARRLARAERSQPAEVGAGV